MHKSTILIQLFIICSIANLINAGAFWDSIVSVDRQDNGDKKVGVHLPFIYWMDLNRNKQGPKFDISVLGGLVKVNVDRRKQAQQGQQPQGKRPVSVSVFGQNVYNSYPDGEAPNGQLNIQDQQPPFQGQQETNAVNIRPNVISYERPEGNKAKPDKIIITETVTEPKYDIPPSETSTVAS